MASLVSEVLADVPWLYWPMDETSGTTVYDASGNGRNGTITGGTLVADPLAPTGRAVSLDGIDDYVSAATATVSLYAWEGWFYFPASYGSATSYDVPLGSAGSHAPTIYIGGGVTGTVADEVLSMVRSTNFAIVCYAGASVTITAGWHHIAARWNGSQYENYLDGALLPSTASGTHALATLDDLYVGRDSGGFGYLQGKAAHVAVYGADLTGVRIKAHYNAAKTIPTSYSDLILGTPGCIGYWPLDAASQDDDRSNLDLTISGTATSATGPNGGAGGATEFNGTSQYGVTATHANMVPSGRDVSIECWAKRVSGSSLASILSVGTTGAISPLGFDTYGTAGNDKFRVYMTSNSGAATYLEVADTNSYTLGTWYHLAAVYTDSTSSLSLYRNGILIGTDSTTNGTRDTGTYSLNVARFNGTTSQYWPGMIAHAAMYGRVLTATEISMRARAGRAVAIPNALAVY